MRSGSGSDNGNAKLFVGAVAITAFVVGYAVASIKAQQGDISISEQTGRYHENISNVNADRAMRRPLGHRDVLRAVSSGAAVLCLEDSTPWLSANMASMHHALASEDTALDSELRRTSGKIREWHELVALAYALHGSQGKDASAEMCKGLVQEISRSPSISDALQVLSTNAATAGVRK